MQNEEDVSVVLWTVESSRVKLWAAKSNLASFWTQFRSVALGSKVWLQLVSTTCSCWDTKSLKERLQPLQNNLLLQPLSSQKDWWAWAELHGEMNTQGTCFKLAWAVGMVLGNRRVIHRVYTEVRAPNQIAQKMRFGEKPSDLLFNFSSCLGLYLLPPLSF